MTSHRLGEATTPATGMRAPSLGVASPRVAALTSSWAPPRVLVLLVLVLGATPGLRLADAAARKVPSLGTGSVSNVYLESQVSNELGFDQCKGHALHGHCDFYSCLDQALQCIGSKHNRSVAYRFCDMARHHAHDFTPLGRHWAQRTNRCVLKVIASARWMKRTEWCSRVDGATKQALVDCARTADICQVLWTDREVLHQVFSTGSWLTVVEAAKQCPRTVVNSFIFWTLGQMHIYRR